MSKENIDHRALIVAEDFKNHWVENLDDTDYHADKTSVSSSALKKVSLVSLKTFRHSFFVAGEKAPTEAMKFGKLAHMAILEGEKFRNRYIVMPEFFGYTGKGELTNNANCKEVKEKKAAWLSDIPPGSIITTEEERDQLLGMIEEILSHKVASEYMRSGISEVSGFYRDPETGIRCRIRPDFMDLNRGVIVDLKTTRDCSEKSFQWDVFGNRVGALNYAFSLAMYCEGFSQIEKKPVEASAWIAVEREAPYEVAVHPMTPAVEDIGRIQYHRALTALKQAIDTNDWPGKQRSDDISFIQPPLSLMDEYGLTYDRDAR